MSGRLLDTVEFDDVGMFQFLEDLDLSVDAVEVARVFEFCLVENFDGDLLSVADVSRHFDLAEGSLANCLS